MEQKVLIGGAKKGVPKHYIDRISKWDKVSVEEQFEPFSPINDFLSYPGIRAGRSFLQRVATCVKDKRKHEIKVKQRRSTLYDRSLFDLCFLLETGQQQPKYTNKRISKPSKNMYFESISYAACE